LERLRISINGTGRFFGEAHPARPCACAQIWRKTAPTREKTVILPPLKALWLK
jgi:hypothetical protein